MADQLPRASRKPKLRSSCDRCGAAKLKCDRGQPVCGRCLSLGVVCVYGVSRKMGKPPRNKLRIPEAPSASCTEGTHTNSIDREASDEYSCSSGTGGSLGDGIVPNSARAFPRVNHIPPAWDTVDGYPDSLMTNIDTLDAWHNNLSGPLLPDFSTLGFGDLATDMETRPISPQESPDLDCYSLSTGRTAASQTQVDGSSCFDGTLIPAEGSRGHDCSREAYDILGSLSFLNLVKSHSFASHSVPGSASTTASTATRLPFDHVLRLNHDSRERLGRLLTCPCARNAHLALLYASIISLALIRYQQAAGSTQTVSWSPIIGAEDTFLRYESPPEMAIGTFNIDDQQAQAALRIQLLLCEIRRTGDLIDLFASQSSSDGNEFASSGVDGLYKSLSSWLRKEHLRIADHLRFRLKEVST